ncbi:MAG: acetyl-CoA C-acetyltransferase [Candidatus Krumholzibacteriota bacterium]|nr:acetyl-CoA C-acetyltransferase [Candidatus Krumholzibacteriota bacterium]
MSEVVIAGAVRTPIGRFLGGLSSFKATELGSMAVREAMERAGVDGGQVDEVIMGNVIGAGLGQNPARQAAIGAGVDVASAAMTINKVCGSGLKAAVLAAQAIRLGDSRVVVAGGMESMSNAPYILRQARTGYRLNDGALVDTMVYDGLWDVYNDFHMGNTGELVAEKYGIAREAIDEYAAESNRKAVEAHESGAFAGELMPVEVPQRKGDPVVVDRDEGPRPGTTAAKLAGLKPVFKKGGTVTAGNASQISDGAAAMVMMSDKTAAELGVEPIARVTGYATGGLAPEWVMMTPTVATRTLLEKYGMKIEDFDLIELNEAFAVQAIAVGGELGLDMTKVNVNGGAVALGHPIGCSGARVLVTLMHALKRTGGRKGLATLCLGGGNAVAMSVEML